METDRHGHFVRKTTAYKMAVVSKDRNNMMYVMDKFTALSSKAIRFWGEPSKLDALFMPNKKTDDVVNCENIRLLEEGKSKNLESDSRSPSPTSSESSDISKPEQRYCLRASMVTVALVILGGVALYLCKDYLKWLLLWMERVDLRIAGIIFVVLFIAVSFPMMWGYILLNVAAGYLYGLLFGSLLTCGCALLGVFVSHELTKLCCREYVVSKLSGNEGLMAILRVVESPRGFKVVILARLTPIPFGLQNGLFAISNIGCLRYLCASVMGLLPTQILNTYIGTTLRSMEEVLTDSSNTVTAYVVFFTQLLLTVALSTYMVRRARMELNKTVEEASGSGNGSTSPTKDLTMCNGSADVVNGHVRSGSTVTNNNIKSPPPLANRSSSMPNGMDHTMGGVHCNAVHRDTINNTAAMNITMPHDEQATNINIQNGNLPR